MESTKINVSVSALAMLFALFFLTVACSDDPASANQDDDNDNNDDTGEIQLSDINDGEGLIDITGDVTTRWQGQASLADGGRFATGGVSYSAWIVSVTDDSGEELTMQIVEREDSSTMPGPDNGTYDVGSGQIENSVTVRTDSVPFLSNPSSGGSFTLTQSSDGSVFEIELMATDLEKGGIGQQDEFVDVQAVIKATSN
jgi:hypothetical protein